MKQNHHEPMIGNWYAAKSFQESFMVIDCDQDEYVEIQYLDGELDRIDMEAWDAIHPDEIPEPEDATAPYALNHDDADILHLLNEIEDQNDLDQHMRYVDSDEEKWD